MSGKDFFLFFKNVADLLLKSEKFLIFFVSHGSFHSIEIILNFLFIFRFRFLLNLNFLINNIIIIRIIFIFLVDRLIVIFTEGGVTGVFSIGRVY